LFIPLLIFAEYLQEDGVVLDISTGLVWQDDVTTKNIAKNYAEAEHYCKELTLNNHDNWRLPTITELEMLIDENRVNPAINSAFKNTANDFYWSSTSGVGDADYARSVNFYVGYQSFSRKDEKIYIRCVRSSRD
jgi:hypothetical protein